LENYIYVRAFKHRLVPTKPATRRRRGLRYPQE